VRSTDQERGVGSGDDGSILEAFICPISIRPITTYTEFYDRGPVNRSNFSKHLMTWKKDLYYHGRGRVAVDFNPE
jgi:hypothetical protein